MRIGNSHYMYAIAVSHSCSRVRLGRHMANPPMAVRLAVFQLYIRHVVRYCDPLHVQLNHMDAFNIIMWAVLCILCILYPTFGSCISICLRHMMTQHLTNRRLSPGILQNDPKTQNKQLFFRFPAPARACSLHSCWFSHHYRANA